MAVAVLGLLVLAMGLDLLVAGTGDTRGLKSLLALDLVALTAFSLVGHARQVVLARTALVATTVAGAAVALATLFGAALPATFTFDLIAGMLPAIWFAHRDTAAMRRWGAREETPDGTSRRP